MRHDHNTTTGGARRLADVANLDVRPGFRRGIASADVCALLSGCIDAPDWIPSGSTHMAAAGLTASHPESTRLHRDFGSAETMAEVFKAARDAFMTRPGATGPTIQDAARELQQIGRAVHACRRDRRRATRAPARVLTAEDLRAERARLLRDFDPTYVFTDDHGTFVRHDATASRLAAISDELARLEVPA
jgi:hypothetical protein